MEDNDDNPLLGFFKHIHHMMEQQQAQETEQNRVSTDNIQSLAQILLKKKKFRKGTFVTQIDSSRRYNLPVPGMPAIVLSNCNAIESYVERFALRLSGHYEDLFDSMVLLIGDNGGSPVMIRVNPQFFRKMTKKEIENI